MKHHWLFRILSLVVLASMLLVACQPSAPEPEEEEIYIAMVMHQAIPYVAQIKAGWDAWCEEHADVRCEYSVPDKIDPEKQIAFFEDYVTKGAQGIVTNCVPAELWNEPVKAAREKGVLVNSVDCSCLSESEWNVQVGPDYPSQGKVMATGFFDALEKKGITSGQVVFGYCAPGYPSQEARMGTFMEECEARGTYECVGNLDSGHNVDLNYSFWETAIIKYPDAVAYAGTCAFDGPNLLKLKRLSGEDFEIGTYDLEPETLEGLESGEIMVAIGNNPFINAYIAAQLLYDHLQSGEPLYQCGMLDTPAELVTWETYEEYVKMEADPSLRLQWTKDYIADNYPDLDAAIVDTPY